MSEEITNAIVLDTGCGYVKVDLASEETPKFVFPTIIGKPTLMNQGMNEENLGDTLQMQHNEKDYFIGDSAIEKRGLLTLNRPISKGYVNDWDDLTKIWSHCFTDLLKVDPKDRPILTTVLPHEKKSIKEHTAQIFFEQFNVPVFYCFVDSLLALYGSGKTTGIVLNSGEDVTTALPIHDGACVNHAQVMTDFGGSDVNMYLQSLLSQKNINENPDIIIDTELARKIKETKCQVAYDFEKEMAAYTNQSNKSQYYELPDKNGIRIKLDEEILQCPESCFNPSLINKHIPGIHEIIFESIKKCESELRREMYSNVILAGGNTMLNNFYNRMNKELTILAPNSIKTKITSNSERNCLVWMGGAVVSSLTTFQSMWITRSDYDENGPSVVHRKCL